MILLRLFVYLTWLDKFTLFPSPQTYLIGQASLSLHWSYEANVANKQRKLIPISIMKSTRLNYHICASNCIKFLHKLQ